MCVKLHSYTLVCVWVCVIIYIIVADNSGIRYTPSMDLADVPALGPEKCGCYYVGDWRTCLFLEFRWRVLSVGVFYFFGHCYDCSVMWLGCWYFLWSPPLATGCSWLQLRGVFFWGNVLCLKILYPGAMVRFVVGPFLVSPSCE